MEIELVLAISGIILTIVFGLYAIVPKWNRRRQGYPRTRLLYLATDFTLAEPSLASFGLTLTSSLGEEMKEARVLYIELWNDGEVVISHTAVSAVDPLKIELTSGSTVHRATTKTQSRPANNFTFLVDQEIRSRVHFTFDYLNPGEGARVEVLYTRSAEAQRRDKAQTVLGYDTVELDSRSATIEGSIQGVPRGFQRQSLRREATKDVSKIAGTITVGSAAGTMGALLLPDPWATISFLGAFVASVLIGLILGNRTERIRGF